MSNVSFIQGAAYCFFVFSVFFSGGQEGYELSTPDHMIYFWGSFDHHAVNITDEVPWTDDG